MMCNDPQSCPDCGGEGKKLLSASSVIFKGSGFYSTDYRDSGYLEARKKDADKPASEGSSNGGDKPSETAAKETPAKTETAAKADSTKPAPAAPVAQAA
jgi:predicted nucleic acid-binding Zn ribbon protein